MPVIQKLRFAAYLILLCFFTACRPDPSTTAAAGRCYYISNAGSDANEGTQAAPFKTLGKLTHTHLQPGDTVYLQGGQTFDGTLFIDSAAGTHENPVVITSSGNGRAVINGGDSNAIALYKCNFIKLVNIHCQGAGRKTGNVKDGIALNTCSNIWLNDIDVSGFQKSGVLVYDCDIVYIDHLQAHDNGFAGIAVSGDYGKHNCSNIHITHSDAFNNPGDPTNLTNHSGNGIIAGYCKKVTIEYCTATNNGWDMPRTGNGPVGIWCFEADSVTIQHCISYANKTSKGGGDGGGYDLDGGVTNSVIQYCLSYNNQGSGFGIFQYAGAGNWHDNIIRYNISENDGAVSPAQAGVFIWNSSRDTNQFKNCLFYNNVIYNVKVAAISYDKESEHAGFSFYNNIFVGADNLITGKMDGDTFTGNDWWSLHGGFDIGSNTSFIAWARQNMQEQYNGKLVGCNAKPLFSNPGNTSTVLPGNLAAFNNYQLPAGDSLRSKGVNLQAIFGINNGGKTFNGNNAPAIGMGASF
ncbi:MAG TPA: right-handed parallel beta-helix repeat-containing protein [Chitinophagaceae bacterium]|nr:right-handed parallel beta-helix repeat-containing protein [Chitinophagaceae bacterium]